MMLELRHNDIVPDIIYKYIATKSSHNHLVWVLAMSHRSNGTMTTSKQISVDNHVSLVTKVLHVEGTFLSSEC